MYSVSQGKANWAMHKCLFKLGGGKVCCDTLPTETGIAMHVHLAFSIKFLYIFERVQYHCIAAQQKWTWRIAASV